MVLRPLVERKDVRALGLPPNPNPIPNPKPNPQPKPNPNPSPNPDQVRALGLLHHALQPLLLRRTKATRTLTLPLPLSPSYPKP